MTIYTDGSCRGNGKVSAEGGFGVCAFDNDDNLVAVYSEAKTGTTNNEQEMLAILYAIKNYGVLDIPENFDTIPTVYTDSAYCYGVFTDWMFKWHRNRWIKADKKKPENLKLVKEYYELWAEDGIRINLQKVKGHEGELGNELADALATGKVKTLEEAHAWISKH